MTSALVFQVAGKRMDPSVRAERAVQLLASARATAEAIGDELTGDVQSWHHEQPIDEVLARLRNDPIDLLIVQLMATKQDGIDVAYIVPKTDALDGALLRRLIADGRVAQRRLSGRPVTRRAA